MRRLAVINCEVGAKKIRAVKAFQQLIGQYSGVRTKHIRNFLFLSWKWIILLPIVRKIYLNLPT
jgi:hypothetical protein